jgi:pimeloyl-ACP methyl ester carboxylesterase
VSTDAPIGEHTSLTVWAATSGAATDQLVVVVHGAMDRSAGLLRLSRRLDPHFQVVRYDRRGYGRSTSVGPPWTVEANIDDLCELIEAAQHTTGCGAAVVFGHSFGGNVALGLADRRPDLVRAVIVYEMPMSWLDTWPNNSAGAAAMAAPDTSDAAEAFIRRLVGDEAWDRLSPAKQELRRAEGQAMVAELADLRITAPWSPDRITVPVLSMYGEQGRPHHRVAMLALPDLIADGRSCEVPEAGHAGPHSHADAVGAAVAAFIGEL